MRDVHNLVTFCLEFSEFTDEEVLDLPVELRETMSEKFVKIRDAVDKAMQKLADVDCGSPLS